MLRTYTATLSRTGDVYNVSAGNLSGGIFGPTLSTTQAVASTTLSVGTAAAAFTPVTAADGIAPRSFAVSPSLPAGLSFNSSTGQITGTPTVALAATTFTVTVTDQTSPTPLTSSKPFSLTVTGADMSVDLSGLPTTATVGTPYTGTIKCTNSGTATASATSATCTVSGLPAGTTLGACSPVPPATVAAGASITCPVTGTPTAVGSSTVTVTTGATNDPNAANNTGSASIAVAPPALVATQAVPTTTVSLGTAITPFTPVTASGGTAPLSYAVSPTLPASLSFNTSTGQITGTPTVALAATTFTVTVTDATTPVVQTSSNTFSLNGTSSDMSVDLAGLPTAATVGTAYTGTIKCTNSAGATASANNATCSVTGLPAGLTLGACTPVPPATVAAGASITCPVTGTPTVVGSSTVNVTTGATNDGNAGNNTGAATINVIGTPGLTVSAAASPGMFSGVGQTITFTYTVTNSGNVTVTGISVTDTKVSPIACAATTLAASASTTCTGTYVTTVADVNATSFASVATASGTFAAVPVASPAVTTTVTIDAAAVRAATKSAIQGFMSRRANAIASTGPDTNRLHERLSASLFGGSADPNAPAGLGGPRTGEIDDAPRPGYVAAPGPRAPGSSGLDALARDRDAMTRNPDAPRHSDRLGVSGAAEDGAGRFAFATSLAKMRQAAAAEQAQKDAAPGGMMGLGGGPARPVAAPPLRFDIWAEGAVSYYSHHRLDGKRQGHTGMLFAGADYLMMPGLLAGVMLQLDSTDEPGTAGTRNASGHGWMAGPYISARLTPSLFLDARALWGRSSNEIDPLGAYIDHFDTTRALAAAKLTGQWRYGALSFRPSAEVVYFREQQVAYTNAIGIAIDSQTYALGRLTIGPEFAYAFGAGEGRVLEPFVGLKAVWDFARTSQTTAVGEPVGGDDLRGRIETGATLRTLGGLSIRALGSYDGIGDDQFRAWSGRATLVVPF